MLISLHLPKTAGSSFRATLEEYYKNGMIRDYADLPINTPLFKRNVSALKKCIMPDTIEQDVACIHGHFLPIKYFFVREAKFITWMRDPVERLASHYYYWMRHYNPQHCPSLHRRVVEEKWSLERFCLSREMRNFYGQFLWGFPMSRFSFIGITEYYDSEIKYFSSQFIQSTLPAYSININEAKKEATYFSDEIALREKIEAYHSKDVALYQKALRMRSARLLSDGWMDE